MRTASTLLLAPLLAIHLSGCYTTKLNHREIAEGIHRTRQMSPQTLETFIRKNQIETVLNLRGNHLGSDWFDAQEKVLVENDVRHIAIRISATEFSTKEALLELARFLEQTDKPLLIHCRSGADRTGCASVLYLHLNQDVSIKKAKKKELTLVHGHISNRVDFLFDQYKKTSDGLDFETWLETHYDRDRFEKRFNRTIKPEFLISRTLISLKDYLP